MIDAVSTTPGTALYKVGRKAISPMVREEESKQSKSSVLAIIFVLYYVAIWIGILALVDLLVHPQKPVR